MTKPSEFTNCDSRFAIQVLCYHIPTLVEWQAAFVVTPQGVSFDVSFGRLGAGS
jgi:hypothetical protein